MCVRRSGEGELVEDNSDAGYYVSDYQLLRTDNGSRTSSGIL